jgi:hypothetical protein
MSGNLDSAVQFKRTWIFKGLEIRNYGQISIATHNKMTRFCNNVCVFFPLMNNELQSIQTSQHSPTSCALHKHVMCISMFRIEPDHTAEPVGVIKVTPFLCVWPTPSHYTSCSTPHPPIGNPNVLKLRCSLPCLHNNYTQACEHQCNRIRRQNKRYCK